MSRRRHVTRGRRQDSFRCGYEEFEPRLVAALTAVAPVLSVPAGGWIPDPANALGPLPVWALTPRAAVPGGLQVHTLESPFQAGATRLRVLLPDAYQPSSTYRVVYVLPVEPGNGTKYGDGLEAIRQANLHNALNVVFVAPSFTAMPWYADHATNVRIRQESHLIQTVIPFVESRYSVGRTPDSRLLLGFSKSGYGGFSLLLRHPDLFGRALAWNAPLTMSSPRADWGVPGIVGTAANFANYRVTSLLQTQAATLAASPPRLLMVASSNDAFRRDHASVSSLMTRLGIPHVSLVGPARAHSWQSGWVPDAVRLLVG